MQQNLIYLMSEVNEDALYLSMLKQMGLKAEMVPADMRETIYQKLNLKIPGI
jgi:hypothetical protein